MASAEVLCNAHKVSLVRLVDGDTYPMAGRRKMRLGQNAQEHVELKSTIPERIKASNKSSSSKVFDIPSVWRTVRAVLENWKYTRGPPL